MFSYAKYLVLDQNNSLNDINRNYEINESKSSMEIVSSENKLNLTFKLLD